MKYSNIGLKIREKRNKRGMTQQQLADNIGVTWEMISRYERGDSSPLNRIEGISKALKVSPLELLQEHYKSRGDDVMSAMLNNIPLFTKKPSTNAFVKENTTHFYNAPIWVTQRDSEAFAIESDIVVSNISKISESAILYISPNRKPQAEDVIIIDNGRELVCDTYIKNMKPAKIIGVVIAQEVRF